MFNDCMEWANVPRWDGNRLGEHGQKISFPLPGSTVPRVAIKRGRLLAEIMRSSKTFRMLHSNYTPLIWIFFGEARKLCCVLLEIIWPVVKTVMD